MIELIHIHLLSPCGKVSWQTIPPEKKYLDYLRKQGYTVIGTYGQKPF